MQSDSRARGAALALLCLVLGAAAPDERVEPHFGSIRRSETNLREGPSYAHRILWIYKRKDYPVWVISGFGEWRHVRDVDGTMGWMHHTQLSDRRTVLFASHAKSPLREAADRNGKILAFVAPGVVASLKACEPSMCEVEAQGIDGWADKQDLWGVEPGEVFH